MEVGNQVGRLVGRQASRLVGRQLHGYALHVRKYSCTHVCIQVGRYVCMQAWRYARVCMNECMYVRMCMCASRCVYVCMCVSMYVCMYEPMWSHVRLLPQRFSEARFMWNGLLTHACRQKSRLSRYACGNDFQEPYSLETQGVALFLYMAPEWHSHRHIWHICTVLAFGCSMGSNPTFLLSRYSGLSKTPSTVLTTVGSELIFNTKLAEPQTKSALPPGPLTLATQSS